jgi:hypothetical protein
MSKQIDIFLYFFISKAEYIIVKQDSIQPINLFYVEYTFRKTCRWRITYFHYADKKTHKEKYL